MSVQVAHVIAAEVCTAIGLELGATVVESLAGARPFEEVPIWVREDEGVHAARLSVLTPGASRLRRMKQLAATALTGLVAELDASSVRQVPLFLGLPARGELDRDAIASLLAALRSTAGPIELVLPPRGCYELGRPAALFALRDAVAALSSYPGGVIVGGVDCLCDTTSLVAAAADHRLLGPDNIDGKLAGEGAGFVWLIADPRALGRRSLARVQAHACSDVEPANPGQGVARSTALGVVWSQLAAGAPEGQRPDQLLYCQPIQGQWATPLSWAMLRNARLCPEPFAPRWLGETLGDTGAAAGAIALALAAAPRATPQTNTRSLVLALGDDGRSGACLIDAPGRDGFERRPDLIDSPQCASFEAERCTDHLEEIGILLGLRAEFLASEAGLPWREAESFEERIGAHQQALAHYRERAIETSAGAIEGDDEETALGATLVASRSARGPELDALIERLAAQPDDKRELWIDAAVWGGRWSLAALQRYAALLDSDTPADWTLASALLDGCCQVDDARMLRLLDRLEPETEAHDQAMLCLATWGTPTDALEGQLTTLAMRGPTLEAALWAGYLTPLDSLRVYLRQGHAFARALTPYLAALGRSEDALSIASGTPNDALEVEEIAALGRIGLAATVPTLLAALGVSEDPARTRALTRALDQVCGVHPPDDGDLDAAQWWTQWWHDHGSRFDPSARYRRGRPSEPMTLIDELLDPTRTAAERRATLLDLRARDRIRISLGARWPVGEQVEVLERARARLSELSP